MTIKVATWKDRVKTSTHLKGVISVTALHRPAGPKVAFQIESFKYIKLQLAATRSVWVDCKRYWIEIIGKMEVVSGTGDFGRFFWIICCASNGRCTPERSL